MESDSIGNQKALIRDFVKNHPEIEVVSEKADDGYSGVNFVVPVWPMVGMAVLVTVVCVLIPLAAGSRMARRGSVVDRLRESGQ